MWQNHNTFTLYDSVSYDRKYNQPNGENNRDGAVYKLQLEHVGLREIQRKRKIMDLRKKQIKKRNKTEKIKND